MNTPVRRTAENPPRPITPDEARSEELERVKRKTTPIRNVFVQLPRDDAAGRGQQRGALLARLVTGHQDRALDAYLMLLALRPVLGPDEPWHSKVWARLLSTSTTAVPETSVSRTWKQLEDHGLIERQRRRRQAVVLPRLEDASGPYVRPGAGEDTEAEATGGWPTGEAYLQLPHEYWLAGHHEKLSLAGKAMLLVALQATGTRKDFYLPQESAPAWYGLSPETVQRGVRDLRALDLLTERHEHIPSSRAPAGYTTRLHFALTGPYSYGRRRAASQEAGVQRRARQRETQAPAPA